MVYQIIKFAGSEKEQFEKDKTIHIKMFDKKQLENLVHYLYLNRIITNDFEIIFKILIFSEMYLETGLMKYLISKISGDIMTLSVPKILEMKENIEKSNLSNRLKTFLLTEIKI